MSASWPKLKRDIVAILRGLQPHEAKAVGRAVFEAGIEAIEVPLNSPDPFRSIETIIEELPGTALVGAGTVLTVADVSRLADAGGRLLVAPNVDADVLARAAELSIVTMPGVFTPTEAFTAIKAQASALKFFPASVLGPKGIAAIGAVLPKDVVVGVVGGVSEADFADFARIGVRTFGLGSSLYKPGMSAADVGNRAKAAVAAWDSVFGEG
ncbi:2-dehydro-3-deoxy-6-phosphogalactonate aldolase [Mesorhizobium sp. BAC0120]|uniref:2-dehydro-3-deoxy-6-phosphogalactonate aldolase n=1 Tax=Mesorhizobium sp. BAC0120 TaxID=3090670 RepID=UPI00298BDC85|nr:2-dehydro-3-deoxy-6-phosphogalactonate aldolase [Mesorhizobium sp. BAC0120]MDW6024575.1 2-dehydro-3-deoxy-6-phosphogalactonate aldolase [Mesorhizobium sp. BAC0120]